MNQFSIPEGQYVDIGEVAGFAQRVHYHEQGSGEPVIFLHGAGGGASGYSNFKGNYPQFAQAGFRSIVPDLLGYGLSSKTEQPKQYDLDFFIAGVKGLVDRLGLKGVTLLGNSLGGAVALGYALKHPQDVKRLILMAPGGVEDLDTYLAMPGIANMFAVYQSGKTGKEAMRAVMEMQLFDKALLTDEILNERAPIADTQTQAARSVLKVPNMTEQLPQITCPVLGFWGMQDAFNPVGGATKLAEGLPHCRVVLVNQCGHWVQVEHQALFNRTCIDFLQNG
ncbi:4,5:9,10-diseco-3-hydroxy-5,9,17-trioxoandrosta-1(10),2-diene-4-oate hydrolase [Oryzisolibacter propanilivorax]|uniref:4,5:9,10-diseco-3-hydroxy-5,9,17-trioxoandrosta-1(10),2-diene-4-oate hydrolase n=1 Tax=Oryzisolibacter propanilivorax TaxID=1527607 RepID=A0A1G9NYJ8_9BURK|nr:alpha/beta hydrolase [Oryzisolibacter propanilivorax]SDL91424.1 4,5:9,10-diseco-3-hydroxy-5,9,17-trioxoandrosta-1(10),2-diene-4-oate hydrolase [Oryzisolibacter propanilivorax]